MAMRAPKQQRAMQTRAALLDAGRAAFASKGLHGANLTTDILEPAGVSAGSFYHQFEDKTDLLLAVLDRAEDIRQATYLRPEMFEGLTLPEIIQQASVAFMGSLEVRAEDWRLQIREWHSSDARVRKRIREARASWEEASKTMLAPYATSPESLEVAVNILSVYVQGITIRYFELEGSRRAELREQLARDTATFLTYGLPSMLKP